MKILHVFPDDKFFDVISNVFDEAIGVTNIYLFYKKSVKSEFVYIKRIDRLTIVSNFSDYVSYFSKPEIDVVYFHSLPFCCYKLFKYIDDNKIVVWWLWGYDIYREQRGLPPLVKIDLFQPQTREYVDTNKRSYTSLLKSVFYFFSGFVDKKKQIDAIKRIDYCSPVFALEYDLLKKIPYFVAKPFMIGGPSSSNLTVNSVPLFSYKGNILIGNSSDPTNNHLDILEKFAYVNIDDRKLIVPLSYGDESYRKYLEKNISIDKDRLILLHDFMPKEEYTSLINGCTHAVFGHMRQQAAGNVYLCFVKGIKVFVYKNSLSYENYISQGYIIYTIEDDLNEKELNEPLSRKYAVNNLNIRLKTIRKAHENDANIEGCFKGILR